MINSPSMMAVFSIDTMVLWRSSCPRVHCRVSRQCREISPRENSVQCLGWGWGGVDLALTKDEMGSRAQQWVGGPWDKALVPSDSNSSFSCLPLHCDLWLGIKALLMEFYHVSVPYKGRCPPGATGGWHQGMRHFKRRVPKVGTEAHSPTQGSQHLYFLLNL